MFNSLTTYRSALMGVAILYVFLFHMNMTFMPEWIFNITKRGDSGVDVFIFLSAIGLCFSLSKNSDKLGFYKRRVLRIFPTYWLAISIIYLLVVALILLFHAPDNYMPYPHSALDFLQGYSTLGFWIPGGFWYDWYIPAIIAFYLCFPLLFLAFEKYRWLIYFSLLPTFLLGLIDGSSLPWYYACVVLRIGCFIWGIAFFYLLDMGEKKNAFIITIIGMMALLMYGFTDLPEMLPKALGRLLYNLLLPFEMVAITNLFRVRLLHHVFSYLGMLSLEIYLVHQQLFRMMKTVSNQLPLINEWMEVVLTFIVSLVLAITINKTIKWLQGKITFKIQKQSV